LNEVMIGGTLKYQTVAQGIERMLDKIGV